MRAARPWILPSFRQELAWLYLPGLVAIALTRFIPESQEAASFLLLAFLAQGLLNSGHVYVTLWRTYLNPREFKRTKAYWLVPAFWFALFFVWVYTRIPYLWMFAFYMTLLHNFRQFYGMSKWYQKLNGEFSRASDFYLHALCFLPILASHFRDFSTHPGSFSSDGALNFPDPTMVRAILAVFAGVFLSWLYFEWRRMQIVKDWNRSLSVLFPCTLYFFSFVMSESVPQILFPLVISHGLSYMALSAEVLPKLETTRVRKVYALACVILTAFIFGGIQFALPNGASSWPLFLQAAYTSAPLAILFSHFTFDTYLWKGTHPDAPQIYS
jgi:hypothetical protein